MKTFYNLVFLIMFYKFIYRKITPAVPRNGAIRIQFQV